MQLYSGPGLAIRGPVAAQDAWIQCDGPAHTGFGAARADILRLILGQGLRVEMLGVDAGFALALGATRVMASLLYGVSAEDPLTFFSRRVGYQRDGRWLLIRISRCATTKR